MALVGLAMGIAVGIVGSFLSRKLPMLPRLLVMITVGVLAGLVARFFFA